MATTVAAYATCVSMSSATWVARRSGEGVVEGLAVAVAVGVAEREKPLLASCSMMPTPNKTRIVTSKAMVITSEARLREGGDGRSE
jgi:hypothetical protein